MPRAKQPTSLTSASATQHLVCPLLPRADVPHSRAATILVGFVQAYKHLLTFDLWAPCELMAPSGLLASSASCKNFQHHTAVMCKGEVTGHMQNLPIS